MSSPFNLGPIPRRLISGRKLSSVTSTATSYVEPKAYRPQTRQRRQLAPRRLGRPGREPGRMEDIFIGALVRAGRCREHAHLSSESLPPPDRRSYLSRSLHLGTGVRASRRGVRYYHAPTSAPDQASESWAELIENQDRAATAQGETSKSKEESSRDDYLNLLDYYAPLETYREWFAPTPTDRRTRTSPPLLPPPVVEQDKPKEERPRDVPTPRKPLVPEDEQGVVALRELTTAINNVDSPQETVYDLYRALPAPRIEYLSTARIRLLLRRLSAVERKDVPSMMRFLSVVEEVKAAGIALDSAEWNSTISFAGKCLGQVGENEVDAGLQIFKQMETEAGVPADHVTFNILFDLAAKAGKFALAERILDEMRARNHELNRFGGVGLIYYYGLKGDGDGVRAAYRRLVEDGHIVDTVVLNCVIAALLRAGETPAADQVYGRMKEFHASKQGAPLPPQRWRAIRDLGKALQRQANRAKGQPERHRELQENAILAPDLRTFCILVSHHAIKTGDLDYITTILVEMRWYQVRLHGSIFLALLKGFSVHGGVRYTAWSRSKLESVWQAYLRALDEQVEGIYLSKWMIVWALQAYRTCAGTTRMLEIWDEVRLRWHATEDERMTVQWNLRILLRRDGSVLRTLAL